MMNKLPLISLLLIILVAANCHDPEPGECREDACFNLSDLENKSDYFLPFILYNDLKDELSGVKLNGETIDLEYGDSYTFSKSGFYELILTGKSSGAAETFLFTLGTPEREHGEWGIEAWTPKAFVPENLDMDEVRTIYPRRYAPGIDLPFVFYALKNGSRVEGYGLASSASAGKEFFIKHGVGSILLSAEDLAQDQQFLIDQQTVQLSLTAISSSPILLSGVLTSDRIIAENEFVRINGDLTIPSNTSLTIHAGALILVDEGINILNQGPVYFNGTENNPILVTCSQSGKYWGGFISTGTLAVIEGTNTLFSRSGYHDTGDYVGWGHARRQALFYTSGSSLSLDQCYMIDHIGQIFYPTYATLNLESILVQRVKTSGQLNGTQATIHNSIFTDFPDDENYYLDDDNDALYINQSNVTVDSCIFMFAKDDGIDSGGDEGGTVTVTNTRFEACFHEGAALSSKNEVVKTHSFQNCLFFNCGQGLELGFSSINHSVTAENCRFLENGIGIRYGDNYTWSSVEGQMYINNSQSLGNNKDVWNMVRQIWSPRLERMHFNNLQVSSQVPQYPDLEVIPY